MMARIVVSAVNALSRSVRFTVFPAVAAVATEVRSWRASCSRMGWKECVHAAGTNLAQLSPPLAVGREDDALGAPPEYEL
jgi:hypothetical protein